MSHVFVHDCGVADCSVVWCEITRDIQEEMELVAVLNRESDSAPRALPQPDGCPLTSPSSPPGTPLLAPSPSHSSPTDGCHSPATMVVKNMLHPSAPGGGLARPEEERSPILDHKHSPDSSPPQPARFRKYLSPRKLHTH